MTASPPLVDKPARDTTAAAGPSAPWWRDPLTWLCCVASLVVYLPHGFAGYLSRDLALYSYAGQQFADGVAPYLAVMNRAGPLAHAVPGVGAFLADLVGADELTGMRVLCLVLSVVAVGATYVLGRTVFNSRLAGLATAAVLIGNQGFVLYATNGPREKTAMLLFWVLALLAMATRRWFVVGFFTALATLTWQPIFLCAIAGAVVAILVGERRGRIRALIWVAVGGLVPTALIVGAYAAIGKAHVFWDDFLLINAQYTKQKSLSSDPLGTVDMMVEGYGPSVVLFAAGLVVLLVHGGWVLAHHRDRDDRGFVMLVASGGALLAGLLFSLKAVNGFPDIFFLIPLAGLGVGSLLMRVRRVHAGRARVATAVLCVVAVGLGLGYSILSRDNRLDEQRADVAAVMNVLPAGSRILSLEAPQPLVLTGQTNPTRYQLFGNGLIDYLDDTWPGGREGYARDVLAKRPTVIAFGSLDDPSWMLDRMDAYEKVGYSPGWHWYVRKDVGERTLDRLRTTLAD